MIKTEKKTAVFYDEIAHHTEMAAAHETAKVFTDAKNELETILEKPLDSYTGFKNDVLGYSIAEIKNKYPGAFGLNLPLDKTLQMLSIDLRKIEQYDAILKTTPHKICVCPKKGTAEPLNNKEPHIWYAETPEQIARLKFSNELAALLEQAHEYKPGTAKANLTNGVNHIVYFEPQTEKLTPNHFFVMGN
jgi:hypothetical protein